MNEAVTGLLSRLRESMGFALPPPPAGRPGEAPSVEYCLTVLSEALQAISMVGLALLWRKNNDQRALGGRVGGSAERPLDGEPRPIPVPPVSHPPRRLRPGLPGSVHGKGPPPALPAEVPPGPGGAGPNRQDAHAGEKGQRPGAVPGVCPHFSGQQLGGLPRRPEAFGAGSGRPDRPCPVGSGSYGQNSLTLEPDRPRALSPFRCGPASARSTPFTIWRTTRRTSSGCSLRTGRFTGTWARRDSAFSSNLPC